MYNLIVVEWRTRIIYLAKAPIDRMACQTLEQSADFNWDRYRFVLKVLISFLLVPTALVMALAEQIVYYPTILLFICTFVGVFAYVLYRDIINAKHRSIAAMKEYIDTLMAHYDCFHPNSVPESAYHLFEDKIAYPQVRSGKQVAEYLKSDSDTELRAHYVALRDNIHLFLEKDSI